MRNPQEDWVIILLSYIWNDIRKLEWLRFDKIFKFIGLYVLLVTILGVFLAGQIISVFPNVEYKILPPIILLDVDKFYEIAERHSLIIPRELETLIGKERNILRVFNSPSFSKSVASYFSYKPEGKKLFDVSSGKLLIKGPVNEGASDAKHLKGLLGLDEVKIEEKRKDFAMNYEGLRFKSWQLAQSAVMDLIGRKFPSSSRDISLQELSNVIEHINNNEQKAQILGDFWVAQDMISFIVFENNSNLLASNIRISFNDAGRQVSIEPLSLEMIKSYEFKYLKDFNSIDISELSPKDSIILITKSKSVISKDDINVLWDKYANVDKYKLLTWFLCLFVFCIIVVLLEPIITFIKKDSNSQIKNKADY